MRMNMRNRKDHTRSLIVSLAGVCLLGLMVFAADTLGLMDSYIRGIFIQCCFAVVMATSLNLVMGYLGQIALGHAGFMAVGAYTSALVTKAIGLAIKAGAMPAMSNVVQFFIGLLCGAIAAALFGLLVGIPALRLRGDYLAIITLGFGEIIRVVIQNLPFAGGKGLANGQAGQALIGIMYTSPTSMSLAMPSIIFLALVAAASSGVAMYTRPSSSISILTPVSAMILLIIFPPGPMTSRIFSGLIVKRMILGAYLLRCSRGCAIVFSMVRR